ncbi:NAD(P)/FAD-dependent oxidoreductase [Iodobacter ciconiae]|uniref:FAD-dependent oxidoreductase n=1 Tax=Iodobacter ciconiae TaxID=2496266 RepID=A0A3S8ZVT2_9NEIS|nr:FAD-dependent oxidoreductase [Iodobacter ciconiae]AZN37581.1 FAD-dependent oxidoreductase [Iodobacter ciconiae]
MAQQVPSAHRQKIAVIGAGISGLASAYLLNRKHDVCLFEAGDYLGGHSNTVDISVNGISHPVDTGFLVLNDKTYPNLVALLAELGVATYSTDMSFGVSMDEGQLEWAGTNLDAVFAQRRNLCSPRFWGMLKDILRFNKAAYVNLARAGNRGETLGQLLDAGGYGQLFREAYLLPMAAAIWSSSPKDILGFPALTFLRFCINHSLLQVNGRPQWQTVQGGSRSYVQRIAATLPDIRLNTPVLGVRRDANGVRVLTASGESRFDIVVFAGHAPDTLSILEDASPAEQKLLSAVRYQPNTAYLHLDERQLPRNKKVWSAWNYLGGAAVDGQRPVCVSYLLNQLQNLPFENPVVVTLNPFKKPDLVIAQFEYQHPIMDQPAIDAQLRLPQLQGRNRTWFAGAWTGYGFHEDGLKSALRVAADFDVLPAWAQL